MSLLGHELVGGGKTPVIVLHEWLGDHSNYGPVLPYLNKLDYSWCFTDLRGYGLSRDIAGRFDCREAADDIIKLSQHLGWKGFHLVGHSMSAMVAQRVAADISAQIKTLVLVTPVPACGVKVAADIEQTIKKAAHDDSAASAAIDARTGHRYNATWLNEKLSLARRASSAEARAAYAEMFLHTDFSEEVKGLDIPVRVITGKYDIPAFQQDHIQAIFSQWYPDLQIEQCAESGHYPMLECPVYFASTVEKFISDSPC